MLRIKTLIIFFFSTILIINSCTKNQSDFDVKKWQKSVIDNRTAKDNEFKTSPTSPFAGLARINAEKDKTSFLDFKSGNFILNNKKSSLTLISVFQKNGKWYLKILNNGFTCKSGTEKEGSLYKLGDMVECTYYRFTFVMYPLDERLVIIAFDPELKKIKEFKHLYYYPPDPEFRVNAKLVKIKNPEQIDMLTSQNQIKTYYRYAEIRFKIKDKKLTLIAYKKDLHQKPEQTWLFIPFTDKTTGKTTYAAGRFLEIKEPLTKNFILDFNEAFNPLCNYSHVYNCSYPPEENALDIPIEAGEKVYPVYQN